MDYPRCWHLCKSIQWCPYDLHTFPCVCSIKSLLRKNLTLSIPKGSPVLTVWCASLQTFSHCIGTFYSWMDTLLLHLPCFHGDAMNGKVRLRGRSEVPSKPSNRVAHLPGSWGESRSEHSVTVNSCSFALSTSSNANICPHQEATLVL